MRSQKPIIRIGELLLFSVAIGAVNLFFRENPGFFRGSFNPFLLLALIVAAYYGKYYGLLSLLFSAVVIALPIPLAINLFQPGTWGLSYWFDLGSLALVPMAVTLVSVYILGLIRDAQAGRLTKQRERVRLFSRQKGELLKQKRVLQTINQELEQRVSRQQDSITALHSDIQELYSLNLDKALETILTTVQRFSGASVISIWEVHPESRDLHLVVNRGWEEGASRPTIVSVENSIEGWVLRNNTIFSVKMLGQYENLRQMDRGHNIMTFPVAAGRKIWGVLNIANMPFAKYNIYTEKLITMILALAAPALERVVEYAAVVTQAEMHPLTGLPGFAQFFSLLNNTLQRARQNKETLSVLILELNNFDALLEKYGRENTLKLVSQLAGQMVIVSRNKARLFHYKDESQIALLYPNLDYDGASLFSLEALSVINEKEWTLNEQIVNLEVMVGYASLSEEQLEAEGLLQIAENILEMQKV
ncbi:MAG: diguanylate cyclase [Spirochaetaceae bacterium]|nr:MAG: diguanylate cyclase [Spirochaetaceae bacterium]